MSKLLTVFGATGNQGGSVIKQLLSHPTLSKEYTLRGVTRDASKPAAQALASKGVEVVVADLNDRDSVFAAIKGSTAVFGITDFWNHLSYDTEVQQGKNIADASLAAGVELLIWSSLVHVSKVTNGKLTGVKHFDSKATVEEYIRSLSGLNAAFFMPGGFMEAWLDMFRADEQGNLNLSLPVDMDNAHIPQIAASIDTGVFVNAILLSGPEIYGKRIAAAHKLYTNNEAAEILGKVRGVKVTTTQIPVEVFKSFLPPAIASELAPNMQLVGPEFGYYVGEPADAVEQAVALVEKTGAGKLTSWEEFVRIKDAEKKAAA